MESNEKISIEFFLHNIASQKTAVAIARKLQIDPTETWFQKTFKHTFLDFLKYGEKLKKDFPEGLRKKEADNLVSIFFRMIQVEYEILQNAYKENKMAFQDSKGEFYVDDSFSLNESEDSDIENKKRVYNLLDRKGVIKKVFNKYNKDLKSFQKAIKFAYDIVFENLTDKDKEFFLPSDIEEIYDELIHFMRVYDQLEIVFQEKDKKLNPFEKGKYYDMSLNESIDSWSQARLRQFVEKEIKDSVRKEKIMSEKEVKEMIRKSIVSMFKFLWEKSSFFIRQI